MRPVWMLLVAGVAVIYGAGADAQPLAAPALPKLITTRQNAFAIPFCLENVTGNQAKAEVQLHVSENRGINWQIAARVPPGAGKFSFKAPRDGEYWFMVRTVDDRGVVRPSGAPAPELRVLVDTAHPQLDLIVTRGEAGEVRARWRVSDANLPPDGLKLSYRGTGSSGSWQAVAIDPIQGAGRPDAPATGEATWWPEHITDGITVRAEVADMAGNTTSSQGQLEPSNQPAVGKAAEGVRTPEPLATAPPPATYPTSQPDKPESPPSPPATQPKPRATQWPAQTTPDVVATQTRRPAGQPPQMPSNFPSVSTQSQPLAATNASNTKLQTAPGAQRYANESAPAGSQESPQSLPLPPPTNSPPLARTNDAPPPATITPSPMIVPPTAPPSRADEEQEAAAFLGQVLPPGVRPRMVNRRRFELEYDIEAIGPEGIGKIELWGTRDGGQTWLSFGTDPDNLSPFVVGVENEGLYGFRIVVDTSTGVKGVPPKVGELPEIWVGVDTTRPVAKLLPADVESVARTGEISIRWEAADQMLAARPIALAYAQSAVGPWTVLASGLENSGHYDWRPDSRVPDRMYLRLEVRDEAGNIQTVESPDPLTIVRTRPQGRILGVRPVGDSARKLDADRSL
ncbi:MAG TPA: Ig-like domain repeat protein [Pirellulales bacterium]|nr:Ig-like domain repeat protein [Pirellulales bacterium]